MSLQPAMPASMLRTRPHPLLKITALAATTILGLAIAGIGVLSLFLMAVGSRG